MEWLNNIMQFLTSFNGISLIALALAGLGAYKKVMKGIRETQEAVNAVININKIFRQAYADKKIDNKEIEQIENAIEQAMKEGKEAVDAWLEAKEEIKKLYDKATKKK